jgi:hypothetical protein
MRWLARPASLAFPDVELASVSDLVGVDPLLDAQKSWLERDTAAARSKLEEMGRARVGLRPGTITLDALYPEAALWVAMGESARANAWLDPTLDALGEGAPQILGSPVRAASLVRSLALKARLAYDAGDRERAAVWARAAVALWGGAEAPLRPIVDELEALARPGG